MLLARAYSADTLAIGLSFWSDKGIAHGKIPTLQNYTRKGQRAPKPPASFAGRPVSSDAVPEVTRSAHPFLWA